MKIVSNFKTMRDWALFYAAEMKWPIFPVHTINEKGYCDCGMGKSCSNPGKHPATKHGFKDATTDIKKIDEWWPEWSPCASNIAVATGGELGLVVIDVDGEEGLASLSQEQMESLQDENVVYAKTGRGGHYYFFSKTKINSKVGFVNHVDIRADGGYIILPPSRHISGKCYEWLRSPHHGLTEVPKWVLNGELKEAPKKIFTVTEQFIPEGQRNDTFFRLASTFRSKGITYEAAHKALEIDNQSKCNPPLDEKEILGILNSVYKRYEAGNTTTYNCTDYENAKRLVARYGNVIRYCYAWKKWIVWNGKVWRIDNDGEILRLAKDTVKHIYEEASQFSDENQRKSIAAWAVQSESEQKLKAMVSLAQSEAGIPISSKQFDANPYLLNCQNGTLDLKTGELRPHNAEDLITKILPFESNQEARCEEWIKFLARIMGENFDLIRFLQRAIGYCLTGDISEQCLFLLYGTGANGKSTFISILNLLLGDFAQTASFETFLVKNQERINNDIARMQGKRLISAIEAEGERRLSEVLVKQLTGGDVITARFLYGEFFEFKPQFKIVLACNHKPVIKGTDYAIWRRIKLIPFNITIPENERDKRLIEKLKAELLGILVWAVQGCLEWQREGLCEPQEVKQATNGYQAEMDVLQAFIDDRCVVNPDIRARSCILYNAYKKWCEENNESVLPNAQFGRRLGEKGFTSQKSNGNWWKGIGVKSEN